MKDTRTWPSEHPGLPSRTCEGHVPKCSYRAKIVIEVDGNQHRVPGAREKDAIRTAVMEAQKYRVLWFSDRGVMLNIEIVLDTIYPALGAAPTARPSSQGGGEMRGANG